jgi:hypothetical protein
MSLAEQLAATLEPSDRFRRKIDRLRQLAQGESRRGYARSTGSLMVLSWSRVLEEREAGLASNYDGRARAWDPSKTDLATDSGNRHVALYVSMCLGAAREFFNREDAAKWVHDLVCREGYRIEVPAGAVSPPAAVGRVASGIAAYFGGTSGATAGRETFFRYRRAAYDAFTWRLPEQS